MEWPKSTEELVEECWARGLSYDQCQDLTDLDIETIAEIYEDAEIRMENWFMDNLDAGEH